MLIKVRVKASARHESVRELASDRFEIAVKQPASENRANAQVIALIAARFGVAPGAGRGLRTCQRIRLGSHSEMMGKATRMQSLTTSANMKGSTPWNTVRVGTCGNRALMTNRFMPTGGLINPISTTTTIRMPNQMGS